MSLYDELLATEHAGWTALTTAHGADHYRQNLSDNALMAFGFGVLSRGDAIAAIESAAPWRAFRISQPSVVRLGEHSGVLVYRVHAERDGQPPYSALVSSTFIWVDGQWRMAFHQQTPTQAGSGSG